MFHIDRKNPVEKASIQSSAIKRKEIVESKVIDRIKFKKRKNKQEQSLTQQEIKYIKLLLSKPAILRLIMTYPKSLIKGGLFDISHKVCDYYGISFDDLLSKKRDRHLVLARRDFCHISYLKTQATKKKIGRFLKRDHTTVLHHLKHSPVNADKISISND
jgi:chromosomal replication initiation ATPase DnaA